MALIWDSRCRISCRNGFRIRIQKRLQNWTRLRNQNRRRIRNQHITALEFNQYKLAVELKSVLASPWEYIWIWFYAAVILLKAEKDPNVLVNDSFRKISELITLLKHLISILELILIPEPRIGFGPGIGSRIGMDYWIGFDYSNRISCGIETENGIRIE